LSLTDAAAFRHNCAAFDFKRLSVFQLQFKGLFYLGALTQVLEVKANRRLQLRVSFNNSRNWLYFESRVWWCFPLVFNVIVVDVLEGKSLLLLELLILFRDGEFDLVSAEVEGG
jgi:hypothetical protein